MFAAGKTAGAAAAVAANYIEQVFSTFLYTGNGSTQTITNGIDLSTQGGLVWIKDRTSATRPHYLFDTARGATNYLITSSTNAQATAATTLTAFTTSGFSLDAAAGTNSSAAPFASWTFRKQPKFFDVVTYTGNGTKQDIAHSLGSVPGCMIIKRTDSVGGWLTYHRSGNASGAGPQNTRFLLQTTNAESQSTTDWASTLPTSTVFTVGNASGSGNTSTNISGATYVAYLFAHNAGGFGLTGTDNVISCGSINGASAGSVNLGYEPQWIMAKPSSTTGSWYIFDNMRGWVAGTGVADPRLLADTTGAEGSNSGFAPTATGFDYSAIGGTWIYIAIRRGPMKTPTTGTSVFLPSVQNTNTNPTVTTGFPVDMIIQANNGDNRYWLDRLRGTSTTSSVYVTSNTTNAETSTAVGIGVQSNTSFTDAFNPAAAPRYYAWRRAPGFFDEVCYTTGAGTGATTFTHNLGATPELIISKVRSTTDDWYVYAQPLGTSKTLYLNGSQAQQAFACAGSLSATSATTYLGVGSATAVSYLFASCPGVSKVGSYTGNGSTQTINCGFAAGARFVLIKRTDSTGNWGVLDTARGMVSGTDPYLNLNTTAAEVNANNVYTTTGGFQLVSSDANFNANGGSYIFLAVA